MIFLSLKIDEARKSDNVFTIALVPKNAYIEEAMQVVVKELKEIQNGLVVFPDDDLTHSYTVFPRGAVFTTDSPEICNFCHHRGISSARVCPRCLVNKKTNTEPSRLTDRSYDLMECDNSRGIEQYRVFIAALLASNLSEARKKQLAKRIAIKHEPWARYFFLFSIFFFVLQ